MVELVTAQGQRHALKLGINTVGRSPDNDIVLDDGSMSRRHAELQWDGQLCLVVDLGSTNGTFVDGRQVPPHQPQVVGPGARLRFGPTMEVTVVAGAASTGPRQPSPRPARPAFAGAGGRGLGVDLLFRAVDVALDLRKLALGFGGLLAAAILAALTLWLVGQAAGESALLVIAVSLIGALALWVALTYVTGALSRLALLELAEGERVEIRPALAYAWRHLFSFLLSPLALLVGLVLVVVVEGILLLIGRIDYLGELVVSLVFLPLVLANLAVFLLAFFGTGLSFPIIADRGGGVRDTVAQVWAIVRRMPGRLVAYMMLAGLISLVLFLFCLYLVAAALYTTLSLAIVGMEPSKFAAVFGGLPLDMGGVVPGLGLWGLGLSAAEPPVTYGLARVLFGLSMAGLMALILVVPQLFSLASICAVYLNLRQDLPQSDGLGSPAAETWAVDDGSGPVTKGCWNCGAPLAYDQVYCPHCQQMQR